jgi:hypothetical protein
VPIVLKYGSLKLLELSGPVQAFNGIVLPFLYYISGLYINCNVGYINGRKLEAGGTFTIMM